MKTALLISTYNWPQALELVFKSLENQSMRPSEVLIADDGSNEETKHCIENFAGSFTVPVKHIWHGDDGFRKATILNKAIAVSTSDYIIQIDGDCIMHKDFIKDHISSAQKKNYLYGSRVTIKKDFVDALFSEKKINFNFFSKGIKKRTRTLRIPFLSGLYKPQKNFSTKFRGCNVSYWKLDAVAVNGYNEDFTGWGREDSELILRMINFGIKGRRLRYKGLVYHIWHPIKSKDNLDRNNELEQRTIRERISWCVNGIDKYL
ncbi:glycosyltransferase family 2 protein [Altibacter lentus]|uniref:glycosyltransferase family 2 protein n=1 Tax=Altibacter lentus TaxID=1223410 RepID=UPI0005551625|nr:glycosyltransferase family 2 protein [Altibacter lentus]